jgi:antitoxin (DNA-binding transcriptional repressor) of toxin-antitoxin stability system
VEDKISREAQLPLNTKSSYTCGYQSQEGDAMKLASVKDVKNNLSEYLKKAEQEDVIITKNGRPTAVLHHLGEDDLEDYLLEHDPKFRKLIEKRWKDYVAHGGLPLEQVLKQIPQ